MTPTIKVNFDYIRHQLNFKFDAGTSRGILKTKDTYFLRARSENYLGLVGYGEAAPLPRLSLDDVPDFEEKLEKICIEISGYSFPQSEEGILEVISKLVSEEFPSVRFALEMALLDLLHGGRRKIFPNAFYDHHQSMEINGLIWMGDRRFMLDQIREKLDEGYDCIKMKIGSIDFDQECSLLGYIREQYSDQEVILRVDANGAFSKEEALDKLVQLSAFGLHSIEQPIRQGQWEAMRKLCRTSPVPIALDEELIGIHSRERKIKLLEEIQPAYIILKPTLLGGIQSTREWISLAERLNIGWWMTSALESNIGLNAIAQLTAGYNPTVPQGLGTGQLYHNNIASPLTIDKGRITYDQTTSWGDIESLFED